MHVRTLISVTAIVQNTKTWNIFLLSQSSIPVSADAPKISIQRFSTAMLSIIFIAQIMLIAIQTISAAHIINGLNLKTDAMFVLYLKTPVQTTAKADTSNNAIKKCRKEVTSCTHKGGKSCKSNRKQINILTAKALNVFFLSALSTIIVWFWKILFAKVWTKTKNILILP